MTPMADSWSTSSVPGAEYLNWARSGSHLFAHPEWSGLLTSLGASTLYAWNHQLGLGAAIACFQRGPFRIGIFGFPVAGAFWDAMPPARLRSLLEPLCKQAGLDLLRVNVSMQSSLDSSATTARPDAGVEPLTTWNPMDSKRLRKDIGFARRANPSLQILSTIPDPASCQALYAKTVEAHGGVARYTPDYFDALARLARSCDLLRCFVAIDADGSMRGFAVMAVNAGSSYYLHSSCDDQGRREGVTDLLLWELLQASSGCLRFNLMSSPWEQPGLLRFKRKWSDLDGLAVTYDFSGSALGWGVRSALRFRARSERARAKAHFASSRQS